MRRAEGANERAAEGELLGEDDAEREIEEDMARQLAVAHGPDRSVRNGSGEQRREPKY